MVFNTPLAYCVFAIVSLVPLCASHTSMKKAFGTSEETMVMRLFSKWSIVRCWFPLFGMLSGLVKLVQSNINHPQVIGELLLLGSHRCCTTTIGFCRLGVLVKKY